MNDLKILPAHPTSGDFLQAYDFEKHNEEIPAVWDSYNAGNPIRTPVILGTNSRYFMVIPEANPHGIDFREYTEDPGIMFDTILRFQRWSQFNLIQDRELGIPSEWHVWVDFQNYSEAAWLGCPIEYFDGQVPDVRPLTDVEPEEIMDRGIPDPFGGIYARGLEYYEYFKERCKRETFLERPIVVDPAFTGTDGIMTLACNTFGPEFVCMTMVMEPERLYRIFDFLTEATIRRIKAWRERCGLPVPAESFGFADDSIALISTEMYREHVLPHHKRLLAALADDSPCSIHLCGDATRHFKTLRDELNIRTFDTGFPIDFGKVREELGPEVRIQGGPRIDLLQKGTAQEVREETRRILESGVLRGGLFVLREGNNLAPGTPLENIDAMYWTGRELGIPENF